MIISKECVGKLLGAKVYQVKEARLEMILNQEYSCLYKVGKQRARETKYLGTFNCLEVNDFYFSYELDLTQNAESLVLQMAASNKVFRHNADGSRYEQSGAISKKWCEIG